MKIKKLKKQLSVTLFKREFNKSFYFTFEVKNNKIKYDSNDYFSIKTFVKVISKNTKTPEKFESSILKFPLIFKVFKNFDSIYNHVLEESKKKTSNVVFIKMANLTFKMNDSFLILATNPIKNFDNLSKLLNPVLLFFELSNLSKN